MVSLTVLGKFSIFCNLCCPIQIYICVCVCVCVVCIYIYIVHGSLLFMCISFPYVNVDGHVFVIKICYCGIGLILFLTCSNHVYMKIIL